MRSRYSAYVLKRIDYLCATTHPDKRTSNLATEIAEWAAQVDFFKLKILSTWRGRAQDKTGKVEFIAYYQRAGKDEQMHETSRFRRYKSRWVYFDGMIDQE